MKNFLKGPDLVIIGHIAYDQTINHQGEKSLPFPSGAAYFSGVAASLFSKNLGLVSRVGEDYGMELLIHLGIDLEGVHQIKGGKTTRFYFFYKTPDARDREFKSELNVGVDLSPTDIPSRYLEASYIHIAAILPQQQKLFIGFLREKSKARISLDTIEQYIQERPREVADNLGEVDTVFLNQKELEILKENRLTRCLRGKEIILKRGAEGAISIKGKETIEVSAPRVETIVDKSGTGDVLAGVFLTLLIQGETRERALREAVRIASQSLEGYGVETLLEMNRPGFSNKEKSLR